MSSIRAVVLTAVIVSNIGAFAQPANHAIIFSPIYYSDDATLALGSDLHFHAYLSHNPWHVVDETAIDNHMG